MINQPCTDAAVTGCRRITRAMNQRWKPAKGAPVQLHAVAVLSAAMAVIFVRPVYAQNDNYPSRRTVTINNCPYVQLSGFSYTNRYSDGADRFYEELSWKNVGADSLIAFEVVVLKYDAFDRRLIGSRWTVTGHNSADWGPLAPGEASHDGTIGYGEEEVFTGVAYVRSARLANGTVWNADDGKLLVMLRSEVPGFKDFGDLRPDPNPKSASPSGPGGGAGGSPISNDP